MTLILTAIDHDGSAPFQLGISGTFAFAEIDQKMRDAFPYIDKRTKTLVLCGKQTYHVTQDFQTIANYLDARNLTQ